LKPWFTVVTAAGFLLSIRQPVGAESFLAQVVDGIFTNAGNTFVVGASGPSNSLVVLNEGWLQDGTGIIGNLFSSTDNSALITGRNSRWESVSQLFVGYSGSRNRLRVIDQGRIEAGTSYVGFESPSRGNFVLISDDGSYWQSGGINVGHDGSANEVIVTNKARIISAGLNAIGYHAPSSNNVLSVAGLGSYWFGGHLAVGSFGAHHNALRITGGGQVFNDAGYVGNGAFNAAIVDGPGSLWNLNTTLFAGDDGSNNQCSILNGGRIHCAYSSVISGTDNRALVTGLNSLWNASGTNGQLVVGGGGSGNQLDITQGGRVNCWLARLMGISNGVHVADAGSVWNIGQDLKVGDEDDWGNSVTIADGARVDARSTILAGDGGILRLNGPLSVLNNTELLNVGDEYGTQNQFIIADGARVNDAAAYLGGSVSAFFAIRNNQNSALVTGPGSLWNNTNDLIIGSTGSDNSLTIADSGQVNNNSSYLGFYDYSGHNTVRVTGPNSVWRNQQQVVVGLAGSQNRVVISAGGQVTSVHSAIGSRLSRDNSALVTDPGSAWQNSGDLSVGSAGHLNRLTITNGGRVSSFNGLIGAQPAGYPLGRSNTVLVTGLGSIWINAAALAVGPYNSFNQLRIEEGAAVWANSVSVGNATDTISNVVAVSNGALTVTNLAGTASVNLWRGALLVNGGTTIVDRINANLPQSSLDFAAGVLSVKAISLLTGRPFVVGAGTRPAWLNLETGMHSVASGLMVSPNASLTASGTLNGNVTNAGSLAIGATAARLNLNGDLHLADTATINFELGGPTQGTQYDYLNVTNLARLGGTLRISLLNNFVPNSNSVFTLMRFAGVSGAFLNAPTGSRITLENSSVSCLVDYSSSVLRLSDFQNANPATNDIDEMWAIRYFGHSPLTEEEKEGDADGDGSSNYAEYVASTDPLDPSSVLRINSVAFNLAGHVVIQFQCVSNRTYRISHSQDLNSWSDVENPSLGSPASGVCQWVDDGSLTGGLPAAGPRRFYRISPR